jgi:hypothetical protein
MDDEVGANGTVIFQVRTDGTLRYDSGVMTGATASKNVSVDLTGVSELALTVTNGGDDQAYDHADWANAQVTCGGTDTTAPTVTTVSPASGATGVAVTANATAVFSEAMNATTLTTATVTLLAQGNATPIGAAVTYDATTRTVTLDPTATLAAGTPYTVTIKGGASGAKDVAGNALAADRVWTFTTGSGGGTASFLSDRAFTSSTNNWGPVERDKSNGEAGAGDGLPLTLNGVVYAKGLGVNAPSEIRFALGGVCTQVTAVVGVDDEITANGSIVFQVWADGAQLYDSGVMTPTTASKSVSVGVTGRTELRLVVTDGGDGPGWDHGDWANAQVVCN